MTEQYRKMKIGVVGVPGGWSSELLADRFAERTGYRLLIDAAQISVCLATGAIQAAGVNLAELDALAIKKLGKEYSPDLLDRLALLEHLAEGGLPIFSAPRSIAQLLNRLNCTLALARGNIPLPKTFICEDLEDAFALVQRWGEVVFKPLFSTKARGMTLLRASDPELRQQLLALKEEHQTLYLQEKLELPDRDLSLVFIGGKYVGTYARVKAAGAWDTTTHSGGHYEAHQPAAEVIELARRAQALFAMDLTSVDIVELASGPLVFEVSAFGGYRGLYESQGIDAGALFADYVLEQLCERA